MIELIDLKEIRLDCSDLSDLQTLLKQLIGQPFRFFRVSYGDELRLHLGDLQSYTNPKMRSRTKGSYIVGARASSWIVFSAPQQILVASDDVRIDQTGSRAAKSVDIKSIETGGFITPGSIIIFAGADRLAHGFSLQLRFSDGSRSVVLPRPESYEAVPEDETNSEDIGGIEIADWEILTPFERILKVGPGLRWGYLDSTSRRSDRS
jgi:hypothetical protein